MEETMEKRRLVKGANGLLLVTLLVYIGVSTALEMLEIKFGDKLPFLSDILFNLLVVQGGMLIPSFVFLARNKKGMTNFVGFHRVHPGTLALTVVFTYVSYPIISLCNYISLQFSENVIDTTMGDLLTGYPLIVCVFAIAFVPCFVEEFIFRGVLYHAYQGAGLLKAIIVTALFFGMFHMNLNQMSYALVIGALFICLNEATGSVISSILMHFLINATSVVASSFVVKEMGSLEVEMADTGMSPLQTIYSLGTASCFCLVFLGFLLWAMAMIQHRIPVIKEKFKQNKEGNCKILSPALVVAFVICAVMMTLSQIAIMKGNL